MRITHNMFALLNNLLKIANLLNLGLGMVPVVMVEVLARHYFSGSLRKAFAVAGQRGLLSATTITVDDEDIAVVVVDRAKFKAIDEPLVGEKPLPLPENTSENLVVRWQTGQRTFEARHMCSFPKPARGPKPRISHTEKEHRQRFLQALTDHAYMEDLLKGPVPSRVSTALLAKHYGAGDQSTRSQWKNKLKIINGKSLPTEQGLRWFLTEAGRAEVKAAGLQPSITRREALDIMLNNPPLNRVDEELEPVLPPCIPRRN